MKKFFIILSSFLLIFSYVLSVNPPNIEAASEKSYVVISNESVDGETSQSTGTFNFNQVNAKMSNTITLDNDMYKTDVVIPYKPKKTEKSLKRNTLIAAKNYTVGDEKKFWVTNLVTDADYEITAKLVYSGQSVNVWGDKADQNVTSNVLKNIGEEFENIIRPLIVNNFGPESDVDGDGKINILTFDIIDGYTGSGGYIAGYFYPRDLYDDPYSNKSEIFYIDTKPGANNLTNLFSTLAHEFQHMVNYNQNVLVEGGDQMDIWLDEALSMAAEQMYLNRTLSDRIYYYNNNSSIANGRSLLNWDYDYDTLANYSLSYLFGQYIKLQTGRGDAIFKEIITNPKNDYKAVDKVIKKYINASMSFGEMMTNFRIALLLNQTTGLYGFKGESGFNSISKIIYKGGSRSLNGGGAVIKENPSYSFSIPSNKGEDVTYTFIYNGEVLSSKGLKVDEIFENSTAIKGKTFPNVTVYVKSGTTQLGTSTATSMGDFSVDIPKQLFGTNLTVHAEDSSGNKSGEVIIKVLANASSIKLTVNEVLDTSKIVTGKTEANAEVFVMKDNQIIGNGKADGNGDFFISIPEQNGETNLIVYAKDSVGNESESTLVEVKDTISPTFNLSYSPTAWTKNPVTINLTNISDAGSGYAKTQLPNGKIVTTQTLGYTVENNGTYSFTVYDKRGNRTTKNIVISNIDKTGPTFTLSASPTTPTNGSVTIKVANINDTGGSGYWKTRLPNGTEVTTTAPSYTVGTNGTYSFIVYDKVGNPTTKSIKISNIDKSAPAKPTVNTVGDNVTTVTGKTEAGARVYVKIGTTTIGPVTANSSGGFSVTIPKQKAGRTIKVYALDSVGNKSVEASTTVVDKTPPATLTVNTVGDNATKVTGKTEAYATVYVKVGSKQIGKATATSKGAYTVKISAKQKAGTTLTIIAADKAGNKKTVKKKVVDKTPPAAPKVNKVTKTTTYVKGTAEKGATIQIYRGTKLIGKGTVTSKGTFNVKIAKQKKGAVLKVYATDKAKNRSAARSVKVQ